MILVLRLPGRGPVTRATGTDSDRHLQSLRVMASESNLIVTVTVTGRTGSRRGSESEALRPGYSAADDSESKLEI
jgi:hypothetical protein